MLDWTERPTFLAELADLLAGLPIRFQQSTTFMPRGYAAPKEARLETFGPGWDAGSPVWSIMEDWWLRHKAGANTPNWDIAVGCLIEDRPGLILVEAKAKWPELGVAGKLLDHEARERSRENHAHIGSAIDDACAGWRRIDPRVNIHRDSHYQLANRLAFAWKLASVGVPVVLLYLGFTGDEGIRDAGRPFADDEDWRTAFDEYASGSIPLELFGNRLSVESTPLWLNCKSRPVIEVSPPPAPT